MLCIFTTVLCNIAASACRCTLAALIAGQKTTDLFCVRFEFARHGFVLFQVTLKHSAWTLNLNSNWIIDHCRSTLETITHLFFDNYEVLALVVDALLLIHQPQTVFVFFVCLFFYSAMLIYLKLNLELQATSDVQKEFCRTGLIKAAELPLVLIKSRAQEFSLTTRLLQIQSSWLIQVFIVTGTVQNGHKHKPFEFRVKDWCYNLSSKHKQVSFHFIHLKWD